MKYRNPSINVVWQVNLEDKTKNNIKKIKTYFSNKYNTKNVKIIPVTKSSNDILTNDIHVDITDNQIQLQLIKEFIKTNNIEVNESLLFRLDKKVNEELLLQNENKIKHNSWEIRKIEFSNFLSYGDNNVLDFTNLGGITNIESEPKNFGGKTTLLDLIYFLLFNKTTKTKTNIEVFNKFRDNDRVFVKGEIIIDNEKYILERTLTRKLKRNNDYDVTSKLDFYKISENGELVNLNGEQRRQTEILLNSAIGEEKDFLSTILTTSKNLEDLIESKPTERGNLLTKFIGLHILKEKEEIAKNMYSNYQKKMISNSYDEETLIQINENLVLEIEKTKQSIKDTNDLISEKQINLQNLINENDNLINKRKDIDLNLLNLDKDKIEGEIILINMSNESIQNNLKNIVLVEPSEYYDENEHKKTKNNIVKTINDLSLQKANLNLNKKSLIDFEKDKNCPICGKVLDDYDTKLNSLKLLIESFQNNVTELEKELEILNNLDEKFNNLSKILLKYEKDKISKEKLSLDLDKNNLLINKLKNDLILFENNKTNIEENKEIQRKYDINKSLISTLNGEIEKLKIQIINYNNLIENNELKITQNKDLLNKINSEKEFVKVFVVYLTIFGKNGISKVILKNTIPLINQELEKLLMDSCYFNVELIINDKNEVDFDMIDNETRISKPLSSGSGYEKTVASLALRAVLTKVSVLPKPNLLVMDEVFGKIADENVDMVGEAIKKLKDYFEHIFIISHNQLTKNWSDNNILVIKDNNVSSLT